MPRIRQEEKIPRIRQPNGNPNLPDTGPVIVELGDEPKEQLVYGKPSAEHAEPAMRAADVLPVDQSQPQPSPRTVAPQQYEEETDDEALTTLRASEKRARDRAKAAETSAAQTLQWGQQQANEAAIAKQAITESQLDTVSSGLAAAEADAAAAEQAYAEAWQKGDGLGVAKANRAMNDAQYRINTLRAGKDELENQVKQKPQPAQMPLNPASNLEGWLASNTQLMDEEKDWIRDHPESMSTPQNQQLMGIAFRDAAAKGLKRGSPEYFSFFNDRMGFENNSEADEYEDDPAPVRQPQRRSAMAQPSTRRVAAPVSRSGNGGQPRLREGQIMLTEEQRRAAKISGISEVEYARGVARLMRDKYAGLYPMQETK